MMNTYTDFSARGHYCLPTSKILAMLLFLANIYIWIRHSQNLDATLCGPCIYYGRSECDLRGSSFENFLGDHPPGHAPLVLHAYMSSSFSICMSYRYLWWSWRCCWQRFQLNGHNSAVSTRYLKDFYMKSTCNSRNSGWKFGCSLVLQAEKPGEIFVAKLCSQQKTCPLHHRIPQHRCSRQFIVATTDNATSGYNYKVSAYEPINLQVFVRRFVCAFLQGRDSCYIRLEGHSSSGCYTQLDIHTCTAQIVHKLYCSVSMMLWSTSSGKKSTEMTPDSSIYTVQNQSGWES